MKTLIAIIALTFVGCATPYQRNQLRVGVAGGFSETKLAPDYYRVTFRGNALTQPERASDFALLHSAEIALENGYAFLKSPTRKHLASITAQAASARSGPTCLAHSQPLVGQPAES